MGDLKSLLLLWENLATNHRYSAYVELADLSVFRRRAEKEGLSFLTTTLPLIGKALDSFHSTSEWTPVPSFTGRQVMLYKDGFARDTCIQVHIPVFLGKAIEAALKGDSIAVDCVRQLTFIFYKYEVAFDTQLVADFLNDFILVDDSLIECSTARLADKQLDEHLTSMQGVIAWALGKTDPYNIRPSHGSGATACRTKNSDKYHTIRYFPRLDETYSYSEYFFLSPTHLVDEMEKLENAKEAIPRARVCLVPKDSRGPRVISCEPAELMYIQQGIMKLIYQRLETFSGTTGQINFSDQTINKRLARIGSTDGSFCTIDLSEASDRVSLDLVREVFPRDWVECLEACRSEETILPNGVVKKLRKFAPMGSSCCFPIEALVFWASAQATLRRLGSWNAPVYVYGDDIIFAPNYFDEIVMDLESVGLKVNRNKSYRAGPFRESCGGDYHNSYDVTPIRVRKGLTYSSPSSLSTSADLANSFIAKFGYDYTRSVVQVIENSVGMIFPRTPLAYPLSLRADLRAFNDVFFQRRWNADYQRYEHRVPSLTNQIRKCHPSNWGELLRRELSREVRERDSSDRYINRLSIADSVVDPGFYTDTHSVRTKWAWRWLG
jgi:hypothetical protein